jgi:hypothetical protein
MDEARLIKRTLIDFFHDLVQSAMRTQRVTGNEQVEAYLVRLLERFAHPPAGWNSRPLAIEYLESFHSPIFNRYEKLKHVADTSLFLSGVFMEHLECQLASTDYYISLGRSAYRHLSIQPTLRTRTPAELFAQMAERFTDLVRVLSEISFSELFQGESQTVRTYTRWLRTRSRVDAEWLLRRGVVPLAPGGHSRH